MADLQNRTLICSVLFIDIVEYSRKSVDEQVDLKNRVNALLSDALRGVAENDRIVLDTGDGAGISFIGNPEDALFVATAMRDRTAADAGSGHAEFCLRIGISLGPVRLVRDSAGQPNVSGDGIDLAQRVMSFARPGQVLVSRSYYEVVSRLSDESSRLFTYEGSRTDKHMREHEVYAIGAIALPPRRTEGTTAETRRAARPRSQSAGVTWAHSAAAVTQRAVSRPRVATAAAVALIVVSALGARAYRDDPPARPAQTAAPREPRPHAPEPVGTPNDKLAIATATAPRPASAAPPVPPAEKRAGARAEAKAKAAKSAVVEPVAAVPSELPAVESSEPAVVSLAISPWGQIYVNGRSRGISPPLQEIDLTPGRHRIELRNTGAATHAITVNAKPGERLRIKHKFE